MKAQDLRIGNLVYRENSKLVNQKTDVYSIENINLQSAKKYEPIPLTEEWLLKLGVKGKFLDIDVFENKKLTIDCNSVDDIAIWISENEDTIDELDLCFDLKKIKYVHQLQNLYHALTGEELTIK